MKKISTLLLCAMPFLSIAQSQTPLRCGSTEFAGGEADLDAWARTYYAQPQTKNTAALTTLYLPTNLHLVSKTDGTGGISPSRALAMMCDVNDKFRPHAIRFWVDSLDFSIKNDAYNDPPAGSSAYWTTMLTGHKQANRVNLYFHGGGAATNLCGVYHGGAVGSGLSGGTADIVNFFGPCLTIGNTTVVHELGHYLAMPHTFNGLEGSGNLACGARATAGEAYARTGARANCGMVGDRFCDTYPDYNSERWNCGVADPALGNTGSHWSCRVLSTDSVAMQIEGNNYMAYADDACASRFTTNQRDRMRAFISTQRTTLISIPVVGDTIDRPTNIVSPTNFPLGTPAFLKWNKTPNASYYTVEIFSNSALTQHVVDIMTKDTTYTFRPTNTSKLNFWWRVTPFNKKYFCANKVTAPIIFYNATETTIQGLSALQIQPNPIQNNHFTMNIAAEKNIKTDLSIMDLTGRMVENLGIQNIAAGESTLDFDINSNLPNGVYFIKMQNETGINTAKIVVLK